MQLISYGFFGFLLLGLLLYYSLGRRHQWVCLLGLSIVFYLSAGWRFLLFPLATALLTWAAGLWMDSYQKKSRTLRTDPALSKETRKEQTAGLKRRQKRVFIACLVAGFGILGVVKYTDFVLSCIARVINLFGVPGAFTPLGWALPLGISYYTFQAMGYLIDVHRGTQDAEHSFWKLLLFILFFPQLTSGPISRFSGLSDGLFTAHRWDAADGMAGVQRMLWGLFKKLVIADRMAGPVMAMIQSPGQYTGLYVLVGMIGFTLWMYADFSGGIDIVIGAARLFGIRLPENFHLPFASASLGEFWTRWHMTLMQWMKDYVFYPAATSRKTRNIAKKCSVVLPKEFCSHLPAYIASLLVWFITGIWHGASERFIVWGLANFLVMTVSQELHPLYRSARKRFSFMETGGWRIFMAVRTFLLFSFLEMFECYPVGMVFSRLGDLLMHPGLAVPLIPTLEELGLRIPELWLLAFAWLLVFIGGLGAWYKESGKDILQKIPDGSRRAVYIAGTYVLFVLVLVMGRYGHGYAVADFFYNSF